MAGAAFTEVQRRWTAIERELYALWQDVLASDQIIRKFKLYCYIDQKNNRSTVG